MSREPNYLKYPSIMKPPQSIQLMNENITLYEYTFNGIIELYDFLKTNPPINEKFNKDRLSSVIKSTAFSGAPYDQAVEKLMDSEAAGYLNYLKINRNIQRFASNNKTYKTVKTLAGTPDPIAIATNSPYTSTTRRKVRVPKTIVLNVDISFDGDTTDEQLLNRAIIVTVLINALERRNYKVLVNSFILSEYDDEVIKATFGIKGTGKGTDYQTLYKTLVVKEFFRRIYFRLVEVSDVENKWWYSYGGPCSKEKSKELMRIGSNELLFRSLNKMEIYGKDIGEDLKNSIELLGLKGIIDVSTEKKILEQCLEYKEKIYHR